MVKTKSYTLNGEVTCDLSDWLNWLDVTDEIFSTLGVIPTECGIVSINGTRIKSLKNLRKKLINLYEKNDIVKSLSIISLRPEYSSVICDFTITLTRGGTRNPYITLILNSNYYDVNDITNEEKIIGLLQSGIKNAEGEIYEMDISECPEFYAAKSNPKSFYKTLNVLKKI